MLENKAKFLTTPRLLRLALESTVTTPAVYDSLSDGPHLPHQSLKMKVVHPGEITRGTKLCSLSMVQATCTANFSQQC